jgi:hypothetical protein
MAKFIVSVTGATPAQRDEITKHLGRLGGYWHWMPDFWLLDTLVELNPSQIRNSIHRKYPSLTFIVLKANISIDEPWAGAFPSEEVEKWSEWLIRFWGPAT